MKRFVGRTIPGGLKINKHFAANRWEKKSDRQTSKRKMTVHIFYPSKLTKWKRRMKYGLGRKNDSLWFWESDNYGGPHWSQIMKAINIYISCFFSTKKPLWIANVWFDFDAMCFAGFSLLSRWQKMLATKWYILWLSGLLVTETRCSELYTLFSEKKPYMQFSQQPSSRPIYKQYYLEEAVSNITMTTVKVTGFASGQTNFIITWSIAISPSQATKCCCSEIGTPKKKKENHFWRAIYK